jgi:predicted DNA-binding WGR domain protein
MMLHEEINVSVNLEENTFTLSKNGNSLSPRDIFTDNVFTYISDEYSLLILIKDGIYITHYITREDITKNYTRDHAIDSIKNAILHKLKKKNSTQNIEVLNEMKRKVDDFIAQNTKTITNQQSIQPNQTIEIIEIAPNTLVQIIENAPNIPNEREWVLRYNQINEIPNEPIAPIQSQNNDFLYDVYLECREGSSKKFWRGKVRGTTEFRNWGRIGTDGQHKSFPHHTSSDAIMSVKKMERSKLQKGYVRVN